MEKRITGILGRTGVYAVVLNGEMKYIGSTQNLGKRYGVHKSNLKLRKEGKNKKLLDYYNSIPDCSFDFMVLEFCNKEEMYIRESFWQEQYKDVILNSNKVTTNKVCNRTQEQIEKYSKLQRGINNSNNKYSEDVIIAVKLMLDKFDNNRISAEIQEAFGIDMRASYISAIRHGHKWQHLVVPIDEVEEETKVDIFLKDVAKMQSISI